MPANHSFAPADDDTAVGSPRRTPHAVAGLVLAVAGAEMWCCALVCGVLGVDGHLMATCSLGAALAGASFGIVALEAIGRAPDRWRGRGLARVATTVSAAAVGLNVAAFTGPFPS